jgi:Lar family restriction alleviation protein
MSEQWKLVPCPFCGDPNVEEAESGVPTLHGGNKRAVYCNGCFCEGPTADTTKAAIAKWNERSRPEPDAEKYGCHCDLESMSEGYQPDDCVLDSGCADDCVHATKLQRERKGKESCEHWKPIKIAAATKERT